MKRYVMTKDKTIYDRTKMPTIDFSKNANVDKSSDNLLDLVEDKDLIELGNEGNVIQYDIVYDEITSYKNIVAIWKRQGDIMRRYEVEEHNDK